MNKEIADGMLMTPHIWPFNIINVFRISSNDLPEKLPNDFYATIMYEIYALGERESYIIIHRFKYHETLKEISEKLNISPSRVSEIEKKSIRRLGSEIRRNRVICGLSRYIDNMIKESVSQGIENYKVNFHHDISDENFLKTEISHLCLSTRAYNSLYRYGIKTIKDILDNEERISEGAIANFGVYSLKEVINKMRELGFVTFGSLRRI